ncbi:hypothetical protein Tco_1353215 [Tanacetum coccineum]
MAWIEGTFLPLLMCCDVIKWSHDLDRGHVPAPLGLLWIGGDSIVFTNGGIIGYEGGLRFVRFVDVYIRLFLLFRIGLFLDPCPIVHMKFENSSWRGARVDVRTYLLGGAIKVLLSYESVDVVIGENWLLGHIKDENGIATEMVVKMPWGNLESA